LYLGRDGGLDVETTRRAEEEVRSWRERNELPFPDFAEEMVARLDNTADYPPNGSAASRPPSTRNPGDAPPRV
jgi:MscS family membrane protein